MSRYRGAVTFYIVLAVSLAVIAFTVFARGAQERHHADLAFEQERKECWFLLTSYRDASAYDQARMRNDLVECRAYLPASDYELVLGIKLH